MGKKQKHKHQLLKRFRRMMRPSDWRRFRWGLMGRIVAGGLDGLALLLLLPSSLSLIENQAVWGLEFGSWLLVLVAVALVAAILDFLGMRNSYIGGGSFMSSIHHILGDKVASLPLGWFKGDSAGFLSRIVTQEMMNLSSHIASFAGTLAKSIASAVVIALGAWFWEWRLGLLLCVSAPLFYILLLVGRVLLDKGKDLSTPAESELAVRIIEFARCQGALRSTHAGSTYHELEQAFDNARQKNHRALVWETIGQIISNSIIQYIVVGIVFLVAQQALLGSMEPLSALVSIGLGLRFFNVLSDISAAMVGVAERRTQLDHIDEVMDAPNLPQPSEPQAIKRPGEVGLQTVAFDYQAGKPVLRDVSFSLAPKQMCALVGPSGSGKTTIARLIARFYDVNSGSVKVGTTDVRELSTETLMQQLSMVFQDVYLFDDSLEANIRVGNPAASAAEVKQAADLAGVSEIVRRLPEGWKTPVGEGGSALSGGERQRVSIARALLKKAPIVLLDEATSALDVENELNIMASIEQLRKTSTLIVIAHKLETIRLADKIVMLTADGYVAEQGTHQQLLAKNGPYCAYWNYRSQTRGWRLV